NHELTHRRTGHFSGHALHCPVCTSSSGKTSQQTRALALESALFTGLRCWTGTYSDGVWSEPHGSALAVVSASSAAPHCNSADTDRIYPAGSSLRTRQQA